MNRNERRLAGALRVKTTSEMVYEARNSGKYKDHRDYVKKMFLYYHNVEIMDDMFIDLVFDYHKDDIITITAHKGCYKDAKRIQV